MDLRSMVQTLWGTRERKIFWGAVLALIVILLLLPGPRKQGVEAPITGTVAPTVRTETITEENDAYSITGEYPQLEGGNSEVLIAKVNNILKKEVLDSVAEFKRESSFSATMGKSELQLRYDVAYLNENLWSVALEYGAYAAGAAHPNSYTVTMNFDLRSGKRVALRDLFLDGEEYLPILASTAKEELERRFPSEEGESVWSAEGAAPTEENYQEFLVGKEGLVVVFNPYQVAPYAAGTIRITVPYAALAGAIDPAGILGAR